jgi:hypothetical protein
MILSIATEYRQFFLRQLVLVDPVGTYIYGVASLVELVAVPRHNGASDQFFCGPVCGQLNARSELRIVQDGALGKSFR